MGWLFFLVAITLTAVAEDDFSADQLMTVFCPNCTKLPPGFDHYMFMGRKYPKYYVMLLDIYDPPPEPMFVFSTTEPIRDWLFPVFNLQKFEFEPIFALFPPDGSNFALLKGFPKNGRQPKPPSCTSLKQPRFNMTDQMFTIGEYLIINKDEAINLLDACDDDKAPDLIQKIVHSVPSYILNKQVLQMIPQCFENNVTCHYVIDRGEIVAGVPRVRLAIYGITVTAGCIWHDYFNKHDMRCAYYVTDETTKVTYFIPDDHQVSSEKERPMTVRASLPIVTSSDPYVAKYIADHVSSSEDVRRKHCSGCSYVADGLFRSHFYLGFKRQTQTWYFDQLNTNWPILDTIPLLNSSLYPALYYPVYKNGLDKYNMSLAEVNILDKTGMIRLFNTDGDNVYHCYAAIRNGVDIINTELIFMIENFLIISGARAIDVSKACDGMKENNIVIPIENVTVLTDEMKSMIKTKCFSSTTSSCVYDIDTKKLRKFGHVQPIYHRKELTVFARCTRAFDFRCVYFIYDHKKEEELIINDKVKMTKQDEEIFKELDPRVILPLIELDDLYFSSSVNTTPLPPGVCDTSDDDEAPEMEISEGHFTTVNMILLMISLLLFR